MKDLVPAVVDVTPNKTQYFKVSLFTVLDDNLSWVLILSMSTCDILLYTVNRVLLMTHNNTSCFICF